MKVNYFSVLLALVCTLTSSHFAFGRPVKEEQGSKIGDNRSINFRGSEVPYFQSYWHADEVESGIYIEFIPSIDEIAILECKGAVDTLAPCTPLYLGGVGKLCKAYNRVVDSHTLSRRSMLIIGTIIFTASTGGVGAVLQAAGVSSGVANTIAVVASGKSTLDTGKEINGLIKDRCGAGKDFNIVSDLIESSLRNLALAASKEDIELVKLLFSNDEFDKYSAKDVMLYRDYRTITETSGAKKADFRFYPVSEFSSNLLVWQNNLNLKLLNSSVSGMMVGNK